MPAADTQVPAFLLSDRDHFVDPAYLPEGTFKPPVNYDDHEADAFHGDNYVDMRPYPRNLIAVQIFVPWFIFGLMLVLFAFYYRHSPQTCWFFFAWSVLFGIGCVLAEGRNSTRGVRVGHYWVLGWACIFTAVIGLFQGNYNFTKYMQPYAIYSESRWYQNVLPGDHPGAKKDGGLLTFSKDTYVDPVKGVGYRAGDLYCAAPIVGDNDALSVGYWAVGMNCCRPRGLFRCDDTWNKNARGGMVLYESGPLETDDLKWYQKAVEEAASAYGFTVPEQPTFVRWVADLEGTIQQHHDSALIVLHLGLWLFLPVWAGAVLLIRVLENKAKGP